MPTVPRICRHKGRSLAYVTLNGKKYYLGPWPAELKQPPAAARAAHDEIVARWLANGRRLPDELPTAAATTTVNEIIIAYVKYAHGHYLSRRPGTITEVRGIKGAAGILKKLFGRLPVAEFGPKALKLVREAMIAKDWSRTYTNKQVNRLKRMFRWAAEEELVPAEVAARVWAVKAIRRGEPGIRETEAVEPVKADQIAAVLPHVSAQVRTMVELQQLTGMRPGEVVIMRGRDIDRTGPVWTYRPHFHKNDHRGQGRLVFLGPKCQELLAPWLAAAVTPESYLFSPRDAEEARNRARSGRRATPAWPSHMQRNATKRKNGGGKRPRGDHYRPTSYCRAVQDACEKAGIPTWSPNQLRHAAATEIRREHGIEMARILLGHKTAFTTEIYAEVDVASAKQVAERIG